MRHRCYRPRQYQGSSLMEVLIALLLMGLSVFGYLNLQKRSIDLMQEVFWRERAVALAHDALQRVALNQSARAIYLSKHHWQQESYSVELACLGEQLCSAEELALADIDEIRRMLDQHLPNPRVFVADCPSNRDRTFQKMQCLVVSWKNSDLEQCSTKEASCVFVSLE